MARLEINDGVAEPWGLGDGGVQGRSPGAGLGAKPPEAEADDIL